MESWRMGRLGRESSAVRGAHTASTIVLAATLTLGTMSVRAGAAEAEEEQATVACTAFPAPSIAYQLWEEDANYDMYEGVKDERKTIRIVGDILNITKDDFGSIVRDIDEAPSNVSEIIFDAREINVLAPISFTTSKIVLLADTVKFGPSGAFYLTAEPSDANDGLYVSANTVKLENAMPRAIQIALGHGSNNRRVQFQGKSLQVEGQEISPEDADAVIWRRTVDFSGIGSSAPPGNFEVAFGGDGNKKAIAEVSERATWPLFFAFKVQKFFSRDAFNQTNKSNLTAWIDQIVPRVEELGNSSAVAMLNATRGLMDLNLDAQGYSPFFVPRRDFVNARDAFKARLKDADTRLDVLKDTILAAYDGKELDRGKIEKIRADYKALQGDMAARQVAMDEALTDLAVNEQEIESLMTRVSDRRAILKGHLENLKKRQDDASKVKVAATVVAIGATLVAGPAGPLIAAGVSATGEMIYNHNTNPAGNNLETFVSIAKKSADFYQAATEAKAAWAKHSADLGAARDSLRGVPGKDGKLVPKMDALKTAGKSGGEFAKKLKAMYDQLQSMPTPTSIEMSGLEKEDGDLQGSLAAIAAHRSTQAKLTEQISVLQQQLASDADAQATASVLEADLLSTVPVNDRDVMRWKMVATSLWRKYLEDMYLDAIMLRRSLYFETAKVPEVPPDLLQFPEEMTAYIRSGLYSPDGKYSPRELTLTHLEREKSKHLLALGAIGESIDRAFEAFQSERAGGAVPYTQTFTFDGATSTGNEKEFLEQLNAQISSIIHNPNFSEIGRLPIPIDLPAPPTDMPERLIRITIPDVEFNDPKSVLGKRVNLDISYELDGEMRRNNGCNFIDMRAKGAIPRVSYRYQAGAQKTEEEAPVPLTFEEFKRYQSAPPARTPYYLSIQVTGDRKNPNWQVAPTIQSMTINLRIVQ
ncbi:hypothetical protein ELI25_29530 (plasmid) [Rhizobium ruizarguesonis]|uniref:hypothetical protein n=1 Tax=Rhizobium ruizarguesonis TaxID=2081791 RepID=UPI0010302E61|nr:hypothetical protein [Rhizobium ruizarguesonis]TAW06613.1 hypothetical protein ELI25_29530 [Rhizobium ruizarguesonis]